jgi:hypothetical protein
MHDQATAFKAGKDLVVDKETVTCEAGGERAASRVAAAERGWQLDPPVCPDCLHWVAVTTDAALPKTLPSPTICSRTSRAERSAP